MQLNSKSGVGDNATQILSKTILNRSDGLNRIGLGIRLLTRLARSCYGPQSRGVLHTRLMDSPVLVTDALKSIQGFELADGAPENMGFGFLSTALKQVDDEVADGCALTAILIDELVQAGTRLIHAGVCPLTLTSTLRAAQKFVNASLDGLGAPCDRNRFARSLINQSGLDAHNSNLLIKAVNHCGNDGLILLQESRQAKTSLELVDSLFLSRGYLSPLFLLDDVTNTITLSKPWVVLIEGSLDDRGLLAKVLESATSLDAPMLVVAQAIEADLLSKIVLHNLTYKRSQIVVVKAPEYGEQRVETLRDLGAALGCIVLEPGYANFMSLSDGFLGHAQRIEINKDNTRIYGARSNEVLLAARRQLLLHECKDPRLTLHELERRHKRLALLNANFAMIRVGGQTDVEMGASLEKFQRLVKSLNQPVRVQSVAGSASALVKVAEKLKQHPELGDQMGARILANAMRQPTQQLLMNAGLHERKIDAIMARYRRECAELSHVYDIQHGEWAPFYNICVLDSINVLQTAVRVAVSVSCEIFSIGAAIYRNHD